MIMRKRLLILGLMAVLVVAASAPSFAIRPINGAIGNVTASDNAALAPLGVGLRVYSAMNGGETNFNDNTASCRNLRCVRNYSTLVNLSPGGYIYNGEATQVYNGDIPDQPYYAFADACMNNSAANHIGFYSAAGVFGNAAGIGASVDLNCPGTQAQNCFPRVDSTNGARPDLTNTYQGFGGAHTIRAIGGLNPIPNVRVAVGGGCPPGVVCLTWDAPYDYSTNLRPSTTSGGAPSSPLDGVELFRNDRSGACTDPSGDDAGWTSVGTFPQGPGASQQPLPGGPTACSFFALKVRVVGPGHGDDLATTCVGVNSQPVAAPQTAVRIVRFNANYAGHGVVNVSWTSGIEGDVSGFFVTRSTSSTGPFSRVSSLQPAKGDNSNYSVADPVGTGAGRVYYYQLQVQNRDGSLTSSSPAAVTLPGRSKKKSGPSVR